MYSIWPCNKGDNPPAAEFSADSKKYGRGTACNECRASRVRCSGKLDGTDCVRCKRLSKPCLYSNTCHHRRTSQDVSGHSKKGSNTTCSVPSSPAQTSSSSESQPESPQMNTTTWVQMQDFLEQDFIDQSLLDDPLGGDSDDWPSSMAIEPPLSKIADAEIINVASNALSFAQPSSNGSQPMTGICDVLSPDLTIQNDSNIISKAYQPSSANTIPPFDPSMAPGHCVCLQGTISSIADLRAWSLPPESGSNTRFSPSTAGLNSVKVEDFLNLFEKSMLKLQMVESCPHLCLFSKDLTILLLLVVEKLSMVLACFAADSSGTQYRVSPDPIPSRTGSYNNLQRQGKRLARFGSFEIKDPSDLDMIMKTLLQLRTRALNEYIGRWNDQVQNYGMCSLETDLRKIREELSNVDFLK